MGTHLPQKGGGAAPTFWPMYCGQTAGWIKLPLGMDIGLGLGLTVLDEDPAPPYPKGHSPQFSANVCCGQTAAWIKMPLGTEVSLGPGDIVTWGPISPLLQKGGGTAAPTFWPTYCGQTAGWIKMPLGM